MIELRLLWCSLRSWLGRPSPRLSALALKWLGWLPSVCHRRWANEQGFTLAELLISLAILGVIATFTIPKIISGQQNGRYNTAAHEVVAMVSAAYQQAQAAGTVNGNTQMGDLTPYMNYVRVDTSSTINDRFGWGNQSCSSSTWICLKLHNGGIAWMASPSANVSFGGASSLNMNWLNFDPDASVNQAASGISFALYYNGQITNFRDLKSGTVNSNGAVPAEPNSTPSWFTW